MPKILLINGSPNEKGCTYTALAEVADHLKKLDVESELLWLGKKTMQDCIACYKCQETKKCVFNDLVNETAARWDEFDGMVVGSSVYYGGPNGRITSFLDRFLFSTGNDRFVGKIAAAVVSCRRGGATAAFERLNMYFQMTNMVVATSQYWNQVHGFTPEDVKKDIEGLQTMRTLAENIAWLLKSIKSAAKEGVEPPKYEPFTPTHFIR
ncbi:flavodoxin family protein [uncultured Megasphaera sp.]|uniref:flavodoxin family protein n=1 Tax=uncultured Megasphaera sp. TaxID=165188 RepID=UPI0025F72475|nr:flavodoxin family protein [uncultured Megasphaera sp.]